HRRDERTGEARFTAPSTASGKGPEYHEVKQQPRPYSDVAAEKANQLSILGNYAAMCRLVEVDKLAEYKFRTSPPQGQTNPQNVAYIRRNSVEIGRTKAEIEALINDHIGGLGFDEIPLSEEI